MKKLFFLAVFGVAGIVSVLTINTLLFTSKQVAVSLIAPTEIDQLQAINHLSQALQLRTISPQKPENFNPLPFFQFHILLKDSYPLAHENLELTVINQYSLLYKWQGTDTTLTPIMLMAHIDVVPVEPGTESQWTYDAYSGAIAEEHVWGRGAMDMKSTLISIMESVESLMEQGFAPQRSIYLAFGHDEELGGVNGAKHIAAYLREKNIHFAFTLDEANAILDKDISPSKQATALIGLADKGYVTLKLTAKSQGGHSSMPLPQTSIGILAKAIVNLEQHPMPASTAGPVGLMFDYLGPELPGIQKMAFANRWLFEDMIINQPDNTGFMNAMVRTTIAPTMISGGIKENVLPSQVHALVNFRIRHGNTVDDVVAHTRTVINDPAVEITTYNGPGYPSSVVASVEASGYSILAQSIKEVFADTIVIPSILVGTTDTKHYIDISDNNYRFFPIIMGKEIAERRPFHGTNERLSIDNYIQMIGFYTQFIKNASRGTE